MGLMHCLLLFSVAAPGALLDVNAAEARSFRDFGAAERARVVLTQPGVDAHGVEDVGVVARQARDRPLVPPGQADHAASSICAGSQFLLTKEIRRDT